MDEQLDEQFNVAIVGTGSISENALTPAIVACEKTRLHAVVSRDSSRATSFADKFSKSNEEPPRAYDSLTACLEDPELDAVVIATPDRLHAEQAIQAARSGKHVLVEKPMATAVADAEAMVDVCEAESVCLGVAYHARWHQGHRKLAQLVHDGAFGEIRHARAQWTFQADDASNWRAHDELGHWWSLAATGTHCVDWITWMLGSVCGDLVETNSVITRGVLGSRHDETASVNMRFSSGATAQFTSSALFQAPGRCEIYGSSGYAIGNGTLGRGGGGEIMTSNGALDFEEVDPYLGEIDDFAAAILSGREPAVGGYDGLVNVKVLTAAYG